MELAGTLLSGIAGYALSGISGGAADAE